MVINIKVSNRRDGANAERYRQSLGSTSSSGPHMSEALFRLLPAANSRVPPRTSAT